MKSGFFLELGIKINDKKKYLFKCFDLNFEVSMFVSETKKDFFVSFDSIFFLLLPLNQKSSSIYFVI